MPEICITLLSWNLHGLAWPLSKDPGGRMDRVSASGSIILSRPTRTAGLFQQTSS